ncbi:unnamed protein product, partial [Phaeothamnion confervicola]
MLFEENLDFWMDVEAFRHGGHGGDMVAEAERLCATYVSEGSPRQVRDGNRREGLKLAAVLRWRLESECPAQRQIFDLLRNDAHPRYLSS